MRDLLQPMEEPVGWFVLGFVACVLSYWLGYFHRGDVYRHRRR